MQEILTAIEQHYGLRLTFLENVAKGFLSENYILTDGTTKYFLKRYRFEEMNQIQVIHNVKKYFNSGGIPVIMPLVAKGGETFFIQNDAGYALFPFVDGKHFDRGTLPKDAIISLGEMLGAIHLLGKEGVHITDKEFSFTIKSEEGLRKIEEVLKIINERENLDEFDILAQKNLILKKELTTTNTLKDEDVWLPSDHLIHGDYHDQNVFFDTSNKVSNVFDFEKTTNAPRTYELLRSMTYALLHDSITQENLRFCKIYYDAYRSVYPLSETELREGIHFYITKSLFNVWIEEEHYLKNNTRVDVFLHSDFMRLNYLKNNPHYLEDTLLGKSLLGE
jgi:Ser/Thr protein kinase RdoA (MazF antagonist)